MIQKLGLLIFSLWLVSCSENVLEDTAKKETNEAIFYEAQTKMNKHDYDTAITLLESLDADFRSQRDVAVIYASAYSGRCGLDFVRLADSLENFDASSGIFLPLMRLFPGGTDPKIADCVTSETSLKAFGTETQRTVDENLLMGFSSLTKIGTVLSRFADTDGDQTIDAGFNYCNKTQFPDDALREIGTGVSLAILSISTSAADLSTGAISDITAVCNLDAQLAVFCNTTDKSVFTLQQLDVLRAVVGSTDQGIGACAGSFSACLCP